MARIPREEHATIRRRVDVEGQKVAEVAAAYGCTPANIYAILARQRRQGDQDAGVSAPEPAPVPIPVLVDPAPAISADLFAGESKESSRIASPILAVHPPEPATPVPESSDPPAVKTPEPPPRPTEPAAPEAGRGRTAPRGKASPSTLSKGKAGYGLLMRTSDGEEAVHPFRSLEELLSAAKPILRTAARSAEPIWFSIQQVDLDTLEESF